MGKLLVLRIHWVENGRAMTDVISSLQIGIWSKMPTANDWANTSALAKTCPLTKLLNHRQAVSYAETSEVRSCVACRKLLGKGVHKGGSPVGQGCKCSHMRTLAKVQFFLRQLDAWIGFSSATMLVWFHVKQQSSANSMPGKIESHLIRRLCEEAAFAIVRKGSKRVPMPPLLFVPSNLHLGFLHHAGL